MAEIARRLGRSRPVVSAYIADPDGYNSTKRPGAPRKLTATAERRLYREASKGELSAAGLKSRLELPISVRRVQELLQASPQFKYIKRKAAPVLTPQHKEARLKWATEHVTWNEELWAKVVFSDEKKFNLDGPDGLQYYWHDLRREKEIYSKRQSGGGSVMVWGAFCVYGTSKIVFLEGRQDSNKYIKTLQDHLLPFVDAWYGRDCIFQQDNASIHSSYRTMAFFDEADVDVMEWPAKSPDLNPIENVWGALVRAVYASGRQFETREELILAIQRCWANLGADLIYNLLKSMPKRCVQVLQQRGAKTKY